MEQGQGNQADITASGLVACDVDGERGTPHSSSLHSPTVLYQIRVAGPTRQPANRPNGSATTTRPRASVHRPHGPAHLAGPRAVRAWGIDAGRCCCPGGLAQCTGSTRQAAGMVVYSSCLYLYGLQSF